MTADPSKRVLVLYRDALKVQPYKAAMVAAGLNPVLVEAGEPVTLDSFRGLLLTGGTDVDPILYGEERQPQTDTPDIQRDRKEIALLRDALERDMPVLAICRGLQMMNVYHGGTLIQHLHPPERHRRTAGDRSLPVHTIIIEEDSLLFRAAGTLSCHVNSRHHQAVKTVGEALRISAYDPDDRTVEALERPDKRFVLAVQWHPEDQVFRYPEQLKIFCRFGAALDYSD